MSVGAMLFLGWIIWTLCDKVEKLENEVERIDSENDDDFDYD